jgi:hypothetical protein
MRKRTGKQSGEPFNPLNVPNVALTLALEVLEQDLHDLPPDDKFAGVGIYVLYYSGPFEAYSKLAERNKNGKYKVPIYVGKAVRRGARKGSISFQPTDQAAIYDRLRLHSNSIDMASNLDLAHFRYRYLIMEDAFISLAESVLISVFRPLWNQVLEGFGINPTGKPRSGQAKSDWDVIHPGRDRGRGEPKRTEVEIIGRVREHLEANGLQEMDAELLRIRKRIEKYDLG